MRKIFLIIALILVLIPAYALADGVTFLIGFQSVSFGGDIGEYYDVPPGPGLAAMVNFDLGIPLDIRVGQRNATERGTRRDVKYQWVEFGPRYRFGQEDASIRPDVFAGIGSYNLEIGSINFDRATGAYAGFGVEEAASEKFVGRFEVKSVYWKSDTFNTDGPSLNLGLFFGFKL